VERAEKQEDEHGGEDHLPGGEASKPAAPLIVHCSLVHGPLFSSFGICQYVPEYLNGRVILTAMFLDGPLMRNERAPT
jgi:hypothetical protein